MDGVLAPLIGLGAALVIAVAAVALIRRPRIRLSVTVKTGRRLAFRATVGVGARRRAVRGATISFAGRSVKTDARGRASLRVRRSGPAHGRARATARGLRAGAVAF